MGALDPPPSPPPTSCPCSLDHGWLAADVDACLQRLACQAPAPQQLYSGQGSSLQRRRLSREQLTTLPVRELTARASAAGLDVGTCTQKDDLVELLLAAGGEAVLAAESGGRSLEAAAAAGAPASTGLGRAPATRPVKRCASCGVQKGPAVQLKLCARCRAIHFCSAE